MFGNFAVLSPLVVLMTGLLSSSILACSSIKKLCELKLVFSSAHLKYLK